MVLETPMKFCVTELDFQEIFFFAPKIWKVDPKWGKDGFFNLFENLLSFTDFKL